MSPETDTLKRRVDRLEKDLKELSDLFTKNDQELRKKIRDIRITGIAGVCAAEFTLANRMGITMDVVMAMLSPRERMVAEKEIERRISESPDTTEVAKIIAAKRYYEEGDDY